MFVSLHAGFGLQGLASLTPSSGSPEEGFGIRVEHARSQGVFDVGLRV